MNRERGLQAVLMVVGLFFCAATYGVVVFFRREPALAMMASVYATLGVFLLLAVRAPSQHRSLIGFAAWSSLAHAGLMAVQVSRHAIKPMEAMGVAVFGVIGLLLVALRPRAQRELKAAAVGA